MKQALYISLLAASLGGFVMPVIAADSTAAPVQNTVQPQKVVYHINYNDPKLLNAALGNVKNHLNGVGEDNITLAVVLHGDGVELLKLAVDDINLQGKVTGLRGQKVKFLVCGNTLKSRQIKLEDLFEVTETDVVPSGVVELATLQQQGYAYIKP